MYIIACHNSHIEATAAATKQQQQDITNKEIYILYVYTNYLKWINGEKKREIRLRLITIIKLNDKNEEK